MFVCPECGEASQSVGQCPRDGAALCDGATDPLLGLQLGNYRIARLIGVGGMGRVYLGANPGIGSRVAVKLLSAEGPEANLAVSRFFGEARAVNVIRHENIVNILDLATLPDGRPYIVMEHLDGAPLSRVIRERAPLPLGTVARVVAEVLDALQAAHEKGIVHRDLKPDNIFVTQRGHAKVLDFGIAKLMPELGGPAGPTRTGSLLGTPHYMAPEQALARAVDARADLYAVGVILYECATGRAPFAADSLFELLRQHVEVPPAPPSLARPDLPAAYEAVILRALAKAPADRFASASEMASALASAAEALAPQEWATLGVGSGSLPFPSAPTPRGASKTAFNTTMGSGGGDQAVPTAARSTSRRFWPLAVLLSSVAVAVIVVVWAARDEAILAPAPPPLLNTSLPLLPPLPAIDANVTNHSIAKNPARLVVDVSAEPAVKGPLVVAKPPARPDDSPAEPVAVAPGDEPAPSSPRTRPSPVVARPSPPSIPPPASAPSSGRDPAPAPAARAPVAARPARVPARFDPTRFDVTGYIPKALGIARDFFDDAVLVRFDAERVRPDGTVDLKASGRSILYRFQSPSVTRDPTGKAACVYYVNVGASGASGYPLSGWKCSYPLIGSPACSGQQIWEKARDRGASGETAGLGYWAGPGGKGRWHFTGGGYSSWVEDRCR